MRAFAISLDAAYRPRRALVSWFLAIVVVSCIVSAAGIAASANAYTYGSTTWYIKDDDGNYAYRNVNFDWCCWSGPFAAIQRLGFGARIVGPYAFYSWLMAYEPNADGGGPFHRSSQEFDPEFAMDSNNGWVTKSLSYWADMRLDNVGDTGYVYGATCGFGPYCIDFYDAFWYGAVMQAGLTRPNTYAFLAGHWQ